MRVAVPRKRHKTPLLPLLLLAVLATLAAGIISTYAGRHPPASADNGPVVVATVPVGDSPTGVAVNPNTNRIYVVNYGTEDVSVIDGPSNTVVATLTVGGSPEDIAVNTNTNHIYVANFRNEDVFVIDGATNTVVDVGLSAGSSPYGVAVNPNTNRIYATNLDSDNVSVIDGVSNAVVATVPVGWSPWGVAINPNTDRIYVTTYNGNSTSSNVSVIDGATNTVVDTPLPAGSHPFGVAVNPNTNRIYVTTYDFNSYSGNVSVIDGATNTVVATAAVEGWPWRVAVNPSTNLIYVTTFDVDSNSGNISSGNVSVIDGATNTAVDTVAVGSYPWGVAVNPSTNRIYVTDQSDGTVSVIQDDAVPPPTPSPTPTTMSNFQQCATPWGGHDYDSLSGKTICSSGCAMTSAADVLTHYGIATDPDALNTCLTHFETCTSPNHLGIAGYTSGEVNWDAVACFATYSGVKMKADDPLYFTNWDSAKQKLNDSLPNGPVIVRVWNKYAGGTCATTRCTTPDHCCDHFVVVTQPTGTDWSINDPLGKTKLSDYNDSAGNGTVDEIEVLHQDSADCSAPKMILRGHSPIDYIVMDPAGRRLGFDPRSGTSYNEIPNATYGMDGGVPGAEGLKTAWIESPMDGQYTITVIGTGTGNYAIDGEAYDENGTITQVSGPSGTTTVDQVDTGVIHYSSQPAAVGGIAELPDRPDPTLHPAESSPSSPTPYVAIAGAAAAGLLTFGAGGWYARRRWHDARSK